MRLIIDALRWLDPIDSADPSLDPVNELRLVQVPNSACVQLYINGKDKPSLNVELNKDNGGEYIEILGDHEEPRVTKNEDTRST